MVFSLYTERLFKHRLATGRKPFLSRRTVRIYIYIQKKSSITNKNNQRILNSFRIEAIIVVRVDSSGRILPVAIAHEKHPCVYNARTRNKPKNTPFSIILYKKMLFEYGVSQ